MQAHRELGYGFAEVIYRNAIAVLLQERGLEARREAEHKVYYHGELLGIYRTDLIVESKIVVEIKTGPKLLPAHESIVTNYLRVTELSVGLLFNFGPLFDFRRFIWTPKANVATAR